jgi:hypothetical protein
MARQGRQGLDAEAIQPLLGLGRPGDTLTLAGERGSASFHFHQPGLLGRWKAAWSSTPPAPLLETL